MDALPLKPPGVVVNRLKGDPSETRANAWMEWDGSWDLDVAFLGVPFDGASAVRTGSRHGPDGVRQQLPLYTTHSTEDGQAMDDLRVADIGDVDVAVSDLEGSFARIAETVRAVVGRGIKPVIIGGDHSITFPAVSGVCEALSGRRLGLIQFDAHHDLREVHFGAVSSGVPFRWLLERRPEQVEGRNLVQIGIADFCNNPTHAAYAREQGVTVISNVAVWRDGIARAVDTALERAADGTEAIYISVDIDGLDQSSAPGTAAPNPFGIDGRDALMAIRRIAGHPKTIAMDVTEISPPLDVGDMTSNLGALMVLNFCYGVASRSA